MKRFGLALSILMVLGLGLASPANSYPIGVTPRVATQAAFYLPGATIMATAEHFCPGATVSFYLDGNFQGSSTANGAGTATLAITAPSVFGSHTILAEGQNCDGGDPVDSATTLIRVVDELPNTGSNTSMPLQAAGVVFLGGAGLAGVAIRRRRPSAA